MAIHTLKNQQIALSVSDAGAEMMSLKDVKTNREYLWQGNPEFWGRRSPVLFPLVGNFRDKTYTHKGQSYTMSQHGFARDCVFVLKSQNEDTLWFTLEDNEETRKNYPFAFCLEVGYQLDGRQVKVLWRVVNPGDEPLYFSIGGHPAFNCPPDEETLRNQCFIYLEDTISIPYYLISEQGLLKPEPHILKADRERVAIDDDLFNQDALIIENPQRRQQTVGLADAHGKVYLTVSFDAPVYGLWSPCYKKSVPPFVCIEPWYGRCDRVDYVGELGDREFSNTLASGDSFEASYYICI